MVIFATSSAVSSRHWPGARLSSSASPPMASRCRALECLPADEMKRRHPDAVRTAPGFDREKAEITRPNIVFNPKSIRV